MKTPRQRSAGELSATIVHTLGLIAAFSGVLLLSATASVPQWWYDRGAVVPQYTTNGTTVTTNYVLQSNAVLTVGQLKQFTARAVDELKSYPGIGAGSALSNLVTGWSTEYATSNWGVYGPSGSGPLKPSDSSAATVGQLKWIGSNVWTQLVSVGYTNAVPSWLSANTNTDSSAAVVGQVKTVFNFDLDSTPAPVNSLAVNIVSSTEVDLTWTLPGYNNASTITIQASTDGGTTWFTLGTTDGTATGYQATGLNPNSSYSFQVITNNGQLSSVPTDGGSGGTIAATPSAPTTLLLSIDASGEGTLVSWPASLGATSYVVDRQTIFTGAWQNNIATPTGTSYDDMANVAGGFRYRVTAKNDRGQSGPSLEYPATRYAVIDLGQDMTPIKVTNSGYILMGKSTTSGTANYRWHGGNTDTLAAPTGGSGYTSPGNNYEGDIDPVGDWGGGVHPGNPVGSPCVPHNANDTDASEFPNAQISDCGWDDSFGATAFKGAGMSFPNQYSVSDISETGAVVGVADYE